ncbi:MAG: TolC family protein [Campylobacterota bacterium]|nr:TolC family protein [Campylobacterota bacterium]
MIKILLIFSLPIFMFGSTIDFETSLNQTLEKNKGLKAKKLELESSKLDLEEVKAYNYGSLIFNENISRTNNAGYVFGMKLASREATFGDFGFSQFDNTNPNILNVEPEDLNHPDTRVNYETKLTYKVPIFTGYKLENGKKMAQLQVLAKKAQYSYDEKALGLEVLKAYNGAVASKEFIKATKKAKEATVSFVNFASELYKEGLVTSIDVKQAQVYDLSIESKMIEAKNRYELALSYLKFLTSNDDIEDVEEFKSINITKKSLSQLQEKVDLNRGDLMMMRYNTDTMKTKIEYENSSSYPTIGAQAEYGFNDNTFSAGNSHKHDYYMMAVGLSYTLFDGSVSSLKKEKAKVEYKKTLSYYEYMKDGVKLEVEKNLLTLQSKSKILIQKQKALSLSNEVLIQSSEMYKNHLINMSNLLMQQANQQKASAETIMAKYEKSLSAGVLKISLGQSLKEEGK